MRLIRQIGYSHCPDLENFLAKAAQPGPLDRARRGHPGGGCSGFGEGASRFTTARVAEKAGVSVGSVYQYLGQTDARRPAARHSRTARSAVARPGSRPIRMRAEMRVALNDAGSARWISPARERLRQDADDGQGSEEVQQGSPQMAKGQKADKKPTAPVSASPFIVTPKK
jgi:hypothetical protein